MQLNFKLKKSQKKVIKKFNRFLMTGEKPSKRRETEIQEIQMNEDLRVEPLMDANEAKNKYKFENKFEEQKTTNAID